MKVSVSGMSEHDQLTAQELRDLADLDALGLLDEIDQRRFERVFGDATIAEQDAIREQQATLLERLVGEPTEELPEELKERVCAAIRGEVEHLDETLAPLAKIGRRRRERAHREEERDYEAVPRSGEVAMFELAGVRRSAVLWRAASFALTASLIAAIFFLFDTAESAKTTADIASQQAGAEALDEAYPINLNELVQSTNADRVLGLATTGALAHGSFTVVLNTKDNTATLVTIGVAIGDYTINYTNASGVANALGFSVSTPSTIIDLKGLPEGLAARLASEPWEIKDSGSLTIAVCNPTRT
jgi:hypothetical protein